MLDVEDPRNMDVAAVVRNGVASGGAALTMRVLDGEDPRNVGVAVADPSSVLVPGPTMGHRAMHDPVAVGLDPREGTAIITAADSITLPAMNIPVARTAAVPTVRRGRLVTIDGELPARVRRGTDIRIPKNFSNTWTRIGMAS